MSFDDPTRRFRRFARAVTSEVGALEESFLDRGRPLGMARMLNAIGRGWCEVSALRDYLGLDSGLISRMLRELERGALITTGPHPTDGRRRVVALTPGGRREFDAYERLSNERAEAFLERCPDRDAMLRALDLVANVMGRERIFVAEHDPDSPEARYCLGEYYGELDRRFDGGFDVALSRDPDGAEITRPRGGFLMAMSDGLPLGCVVLKRASDGIAELKRLWVAESARGLGIGRRLIAAVEDLAIELGATTLRLDTNRALGEAAAMYRALGWTEIARFNDDPYADFFFEKRLGAPGSQDQN